MKYLKHLLLEEDKVKNLIVSNESIINNVNLSKIILEVKNYVINNIGQFIDSDGDLEKTYENISDFSEKRLVNLLERSSSIINDDTASDYLKARLINEAFERTKAAAGWAGSKAKTTGGKFKSGYYGSRPTPNVQSYADLNIQPTTPSERVGGFFSRRREGVRDNWQGGGYINKGKAGLKTAAYAVGSLLAIKTLTDALDPNIFERLRIQDFSKGTWTSKSWDKIDKALSEVIPFWDHDSDKTSELINKYQSYLTKYGEEISNQMGEKTVENQLNLIMLRADMSKAIDELNTIWPSLDQDYVSGKDKVINNTEKLIEVINNHLEAIDKTPELGPIARFFGENGGIVTIGLVVPALLYMGYIKHKDFIKVKFFDMKLDKYIENLSRLGFSQTTDLKNKAISQRTQCESNIRREEGIFKIKDPLKCYVNYSSVIIMIIVSALAESCLKNGVNISNVKSIGQLISLKDNRKDRGVNEIAVKAYTDYKEFIAVVFNNNATVQKITKDLDDKFKQINTKRIN
jgi:hypothetical protein